MSPNHSLDLWKKWSKFMGKLLIKRKRKEYLGLGN